MVDDASRLRGLARLARDLDRANRPEAMLRLAAEEARAALRAATVSFTRLRPDPTIPLTAAGALAEIDAAAGLGSPTGAETGPGSVLAVPLVVDAHPWGELLATPTAERGPFDGVDVAFAVILGAVLAGGLARVIRAENLERLAFRDPLSGLVNRTALDDAAAHLLERLENSPGQRVTAVAIDLSGLPVRVGDRETDGDRQLAEVATLLVHHFSPLTGSLVARVGGGEFSVLVPRHPVTAVVAAAEAFCAEAGALPAGTGLSCGVASTTGAQPWETVEHLFRTADRARHESRRRGGRTPVLA
jgi:diguanylate cyclase (GGDEF)-like protein